MPAVPNCWRVFAAMAFSGCFFFRPVRVFPAAFLQVRDYRGSFGALGQYIKLYPPVEGPSADAARVPESGEKDETSRVAPIETTTRRTSGLWETHDAQLRAGQIWARRSGHFSMDSSHRDGPAELGPDRRSYTQARPSGVAPFNAAGHLGICCLSCFCCTAPILFGQIRQPYEDKENSRWDGARSADAAVAFRRDAQVRVSPSLGYS